MSRRVLGRVMTVVLLAIVLFGMIAPGGGDPDRHRSITTRLRCPVCQGESVADSPSETAIDISALVREQIDSGMSDDEIFDFYAARYGDWVLLDPGLSARTVALWGIPAVVLVGGAALIWRQQTEHDEVIAEVDDGAEVGVAPARAARVSRRGTLKTGLVLLGGAAVVGVVVAQMSDPRPTGGFVTGNLETASPGRDLSTVTAAEMEQVVAENPGVVAMRVALIERHLEEGDVERAHEHSVVVLANDPPPAEYQAGLKYNGWTLALLGDPEGGKELLEASLALAPGDRDARWFLANVLLVGLEQPAEAAVLLEELLAEQPDEGQQQRIRETLERAEALIS